MEDLDMLRKAFSITLLAVAIAPLAHAGDAKSDINAIYQKLNTAVLKSDSKAVTKWVQDYCSADFSYTSKDKQTYKKEPFLSGLIQQLKATKQVLVSTVKIESVVTKGSFTTLSCVNDFKGKVAFDSKQLTLTSKSSTTDSWVKVGNSWKVKKMVEVKNDTQMFEK
ncbi:hypothetical protein BH11ARM1_BH11ARM1_14960 [soil metagenome]